MLAVSGCKRIFVDPLTRCKLNWCIEMSLPPVLQQSWEAASRADSNDSSWDASSTGGPLGGPQGSWDWLGSRNSGGLQSYLRPVDDAVIAEVSAWGLAASCKYEIAAKSAMTGDNEYPPVCIGLLSGQQICTADRLQ